MAAGADRRREGSGGYAVGVNELLDDVTAHTARRCSGPVRGGEGRSRPGIDVEARRRRCAATS